jgi:hypothetical protein
MFTQGQRVRCIGMNPTYGNKLDIGQSYTILKVTVHGDWTQIWVTENNGVAWYHSEFFEALGEETVIAERAPRVKWTKELLQTEASKYKTRTQFSRYSNNAYSAAIRTGLLEEITTHMPQRYYEKKKTEGTDGKRLFIRYPNRKLYDTESSKYVTLAHILGMPVGTFKVIDNGSKKDVTDFILIQGVTAILHEQPEKFEAIKTVLIEKEILKGAPSA